MKKIFFAIITIATIFTSCKKETTAPEYNPAVMGKINVEFDNVVGSTNLQLNTGIYTNSSSQQYKVTQLKYFVSNFKFTRVDGTEYVVPQDQSYFLIDESNAARDKASMNIPEGEYKTVSFIIGVDSLRNTRDVSQRTGDLDVTAAANGMYWSWNSGYIFFRLEGTSTVIPSAAQTFQYHIGGFGGFSAPTANNIRTVTLDLATRGTAKEKASKVNGVDVHNLVDVNKVFNGVNTMNLTTSFNVHSPTAGATVAANLPAIFSHDHTHN
jgi:hypothetical protein